MPPPTNPTCTRTQLLHATRVSFRRFVDVLSKFSEFIDRQIFVDSVDRKILFLHTVCTICTDVFRGKIENPIASKRRAQFSNTYYITFETHTYHTRASISSKKKVRTRSFGARAGTSNAYS